MQAWLQALKNTIYPIFCAQCDDRILTDENGYFCPTCWEKSPAIQRPYCTQCGRPHPMRVGFGTQQNFPCSDCRDNPNPHIHRCYGATRYDDAMEEAIKLLKFHGKVRLIEPIAERMIDFAMQEMDMEQYHAVVPVPLHKVRHRMRGFNQSQLLAEAILPHFPNAALDASLKRIRPTRTQSHLSGAERQKNVQGAFAVVGDTLQSKRVLLIDDVVTSAGTVTECARVLLRAGAVQVDVFASALASHDSPRPLFVE